VIATGNEYPDWRGVKASIMTGEQ